MTQALFYRDGDAYVPTELSGGPWSPSHLHGGPPTGLLAYVASGHAPKFQLARLSVDLLRPIPRAPLQTRSEVVRSGQRLRVVATSLYAEGKEVARATALFLAPQNVVVPGHARYAAVAPPLDTNAPRGSLNTIARWPGSKATPPGLHTTAETVLVDGVEGRGAGCVWMRLPVPLVEGEPLTPTLQAATLADFGNGVGQLRLDEDAGCINADVNLFLHRAPADGWLGIEAQSRMESHGRGLVETQLYDRHGPVGRVVQTILAMPVYRG